MFFWQSHILGSFFLEIRGECHWQDNFKTQVTEILITFLFYQTEKQTNSRRIRNKHTEADTQPVPSNGYPVKLTKKNPLNR